MSDKTFEPNKRGANQLIQYLNQHGKGTTVYTLVETLDWGIGSERLYNERTFTHRHPITRSWITGHLCPEGLLTQEGRVYTSPPRSARNSADPSPQVRFALGEDYRGAIDEAEIRDLNKRLRDAPHRSTRRI